MAKIKNPWLNPLQRSYQQIKTKLVEALTNIKGPDGKTLVTDYSEGNILIIILSLFSGIAEVLHYYIDNMARETFFSTARRYESLVKHAQLVDYYPKGATAASVDVVLNRTSDDPSNSSNMDIAIGTLFTDTSGNKWYTTKAAKWYANTSSITLSLIQHEYYTLSKLIGLVIPNVNNPVISVPSIGNGKFYENGTMTLKIGEDTWTLVETFAYSSPTDKHFRVNVDSSQNVTIVFGNGKFGSKLEPGQAISDCTCYITNGAIGNIKSGSLTSAPSSILTKASTVTCTNPYNAAGGSNYEDFESLKTRIPLSARTQGVAITKQDFIDLALSIPSVSKAALEYECGRKLNLYIAGIGGTVASNTLVNQVYNYVSQRAPITTWLSVKSVGVSNIMLDISVTGKRGFSTVDIYNQIVSALTDKYSPQNSDIGRGIRVSDVYALLDNLSMVDYLTIRKLYVMPWPKTIYGKTALTINSYTLTQAPSSPVEYLVTFISSTQYQLISKDGKYRSGIYTVGTSVTINDQPHGVTFAWSILKSTHLSGYKYSVTITTYNDDIDNVGYNLAVFTNPDTQLVANINETI